MIGILNAYYLHQDPNSYQADYGRMLKKQIAEVFPNESLQEYHVALGVFPDSPQDCDLWIVSGSAKSAYETDPWIGPLAKFLRHAHSARSYTVGFCFGHQMIAQALGGRVEKSNKGWGIGPRTFNVLKSMEWMQPNIDSPTLLYSHQDQVVELPSGAVRIATSSFCPNEMYLLDRHIFCMQGHPEFTLEFAKNRYATNREKAGEATYSQAMANINTPVDSDAIWSWVRHWFESR